MVTFDHEKLDVYKLAVEFADLAEEIAAELPAGYSELKSQLRKSSTSVVLNIAEGAGEYYAGEKARFYLMALRSGTESAGALHTIERRKLANLERVELCRALLKRVVEMLTKLVKSMHRRQHGPGSDPEPGPEPGPEP